MPYNGINTNDKSVKMYSRLFSYDENGATRRRIKNKKMSIIAKSVEKVSSKQGFIATIMKT